MDITFIEKNIVILGNFKPSKYDKLFFIKNNTKTTKWYKYFKKKCFLIKKNVFTKHFDKYSSYKVHIT